MISISSHRIIFIASVVLALLFLSLSPLQSQEPAALKHKNFLILHSYSTDHEWTRKLNNGIISELGKLDWTNSYRFEYMDSNNFFSQNYLLHLKEIYRIKYSEFHIDGIIAVDNNALDFLALYGRPLFANAPIVSIGINTRNSIPENLTGTTVILEQANHLETLKQALAQNSDATEGYIVADNSTSGLALLEEVKQLLPQLQTDIRLTIVAPMPFEELIEWATTRDNNNFIYLLPYFRDSTGRSFEQGYVARFLAKVAKIPTYVSWDFQLGTGVVGGRVVSGSDHGRMAATTLIDNLQGKSSVSLIELSGDTQKNIYDYAVTQQIDVPTKKLPDDIEYINKPVSLYQQHKAVLLPLMFIIVALSAYLFLILKNLASQKIINRHSNEILALNAELIETQKGLVSTLGEVIESRSEETGNHVRRVALISRYIGEKVGLNDHELDTLEAASPLHDVGKIGISDTILHKPGTLTPDEFEIIKQHTTIGKNILQYSDRELLSSASEIAYQHHERWDGTGYPNGIRGVEINILARITMLVDVYDALKTTRCYKTAWPEDKITAYLRQQSGHHFDPELVMIFLDNIDDIQEIHAMNSPADSV